MFCAWLIRRWNFAYLHHIHTRESPSEYSERRYWSTLMYVVLKFLSCLQFQYQTAGIRKLLVRWCGLIFLHSYLGGVLKFFDIWLGLAASSNVKEFQYSSSVTVQEYPIHTALHWFAWAFERFFMSGGLDFGGWGWGGATSFSSAAGPNREGHLTHAWHFSFSFNKFIVMKCCKLYYSFIVL